MLKVCLYVCEREREEESVLRVCLYVCVRVLRVCVCVYVCVCERECVC